MSASRRPKEERKEQRIVHKGRLFDTHACAYVYASMTSSVHPFLRHQWLRRGYPSYSKGPAQQARTRLDADIQPTADTHVHSGKDRR